MFRTALVLCALALTSLAHAAPVSFKATDGVSLSGDLTGAGGARGWCSSTAAPAIAPTGRPW